MKKKRIDNVLVLLVFMLIMVALGISDSNRGVFSSIFERELRLTKPQLSLIVTVSYVGNLLFMLFGGKIADRMDRKKACMGILGLWTAAQILFACTDNYLWLLVGMFVSMGASTLMNTMINILSPFFFGAMAGLYVNVLFFVQGIGTSGNQKITGTLADSYAQYRLLCLGMAVVGVVSLLILSRTRFEKTGEGAKSWGERPGGEAAPAQSHASGTEVKSGARRTAAVSGMVLAMGLVFGFYFVAEHGIMNWWSMYCSQGLGLDNGMASTSVSLFFGTMTAGRLLMAPVVQKLGSRRSILILGGAGTLLYLMGVLLGAKGVLLLGISGIFLSIVYPTMVLLLQELFPKERITAMTGMVISIGTLFDIAFNVMFGSLVTSAGFGVCRLIFPVAIAGFYLLFFMVTGRRKIK